MVFDIKICGVTNIQDAQTAVKAGANAIGLNFYRESPRFIDTKTGSAIVNAVPADLLKVGVVVNEEIESLRDLIAELGTDSPFVGLNAIQLHGDETPDYVAKVKTHFLIRARRFTDQGIAPIAADLASCQALQSLPDAVLIDAVTPGRYGGTGTTVSWSGLADYRRWLHNVPLILAGGLTPENVAEAIRIVRPHGVDVASGVESSPGKKDHAKVRDFVAAAREAFAS
jgi:phosphoribosylanthranilate isomerase